jgi:hypothetical protein
MAQNPKIGIINTAGAKTFTPPHSDKTELGFFSPGYNARGNTLTTHLHLMHRCIPPFHIRQFSYIRNEFEPH